MYQMIFTLEWNLVKMTGKSMKIQIFVRFNFKISVQTFFSFWETIGHNWKHYLGLIKLVECFTLIFLSQITILLLTIVNKNYLGWGLEKKNKRVVKLLNTTCFYKTMYMSGSFSKKNISLLISSLLLSVILSGERGVSKA